MMVAMTGKKTGQEIVPPPFEQGGTHDLVDVPDWHCPHCRVRVGVLEEQEMITIYRVYRFKRRCGLPRIHALKQAIQAALRP
jgi:hypothetical protein